jgi:uncharacterized protein YhfF
MQVNATACQTFWQEYLRGLPASHAHHQIKPDTFAFGDSKELADELAQLVLAGKKTATASLGVEFTSLNEPLPKTGDVCIILGGDSNPVAIVERTDVKTAPFQSVGAAFAATTPVLCQSFRLLWSVSSRSAPRA